MSEREWCQVGGRIGNPRQPISEEWLIAHGFRISSGRNDPKMPIRSLAIGPRVYMGSSDDLCIDISPNRGTSVWFVWVAQREPYRHIHVRMMQETWEVIRLYEGLTGELWTGSCEVDLSPAPLSTD